MNGKHLIVDFYECNKKKILNSVFDLLLNLPKVIGMTKLTQPYVFPFHPKTKQGWNWGISGFVIIAESHISIHTVSDERRVYLDVFSCKNFDTKPVISFIRKTFEPKKLSYKEIERPIII